MRQLATFVLAAASLAAFPALRIFGLQSLVLWIWGQDSPTLRWMSLGAAGLAVILAASLIGGWMSVRRGKPKLTMGFAIIACAIDAIGLQQQWMLS